MDSKHIRNSFLNFFKHKEHEIVPSAPMVVKNDPTLMFTNAGMNQFKDFFLGNKKATFKRVADTQKCLRVSGKHNDLEEVGIDTYHHTMFEMLGNWSFGDYFKKEAIDWAWELLTEVYKLKPDRLYATYFGGDKQEQLVPDLDARDQWQNHLPENRILPFGRKDNFWEMGDQGPCGPCSEIHYDLRPDSEREEVSGATLVNQDHPQVIEIWNLVFIQFNRLASGALEGLPEKHVDTGLGFERLVRVIQGKSSNYDTDIFQPLLSRISELSGIPYHNAEATDIAMRVIADHIRALAFAIADGEMPSNTKGGYVIRRILRRAVRYGYTFLGFREPFLYQLVEVLSGKMGEVFPELPQQAEFIRKVIHEEESAFLRTLANGMSRFQKYLDSDTSIEQIDGAFAFELYDTFGFPVDLTQLIARENRLEVDLPGFQSAMDQQKNRSRAAQDKDEGDWVKVSEGSGVLFTGYEELESVAKVQRYRKVQTKNKKHYQLVLDRTPFYAESGGQVGDTGVIETNSGKIPVWDTKKENDLIVHLVNELPDPIDQPLKAIVNRQKRQATENNHSATHLLHAALRQVLGDHVQQRGSLVNDQVLRFDFSHFSRMSPEEVAKVEHLVNLKIRENIVREVREDVPLARAREMGAMALFGEKYGESVRVVCFDPKFSIELCGGTHVKATGQLGLFKIVSEGSVASGIRRIEAITASKAEELVDRRFNELDQIGEILKSPGNAVKALSALVDERNQLNRELERLQRNELQRIKLDLLGEIVKEAGMSQLIAEVKLPSAQALKDLSFELKNQVNGLFAILAADIDGKPQIAVTISEELVKSHALDAGAIVRDLAKHIKGGGGGQPFFATAGGKDLGGLTTVVKEGKKTLSKLVISNKQNS
ncbi:MAG: alanine--tRNA ligase [Cyclobacteriaceae bacterium]|nr:MAG: alanine--tRNA ligase [Cyclobacteriaceae bacterium]